MTFPHANQTRVENWKPYYFFMEILHIPRWSGSWYWILTSLKLFNKAFVKFKVEHKWNKRIKLRLSGFMS